MSSTPNSPTSKGKTFSNKIFARLRVAIESDVPHIYKLRQRLAAHHNIGHLLKSTETSIASGIFNPKFNPVTALVVDVSPIFFPPAHFNINTLGVKEINLNSSFKDDESDEFKVDHNGDIFIAGYILYYPCFSSFYEKPVFNFENLYVRECYRGKKLGKWMFSAMAFEATRTGISAINWYTSEWNKSAVEFYTNLGAKVCDDFRMLTLTGKGLEAFDDDSNI
ncbi:tyramine N-feruloyltransferase 4/11-like [Lycium ferocissimum]|uniref:tyramine N-feruloyltransferase 4/11-like n=1 Tax=Lycium ferocissimum TaxID=112874 RepID=UPI00281557BB|nr:tyramine N-feruloyltransferase 4/11-like [Lycium ferocissimum]